ncbi:tRNA-specific 2-thiouridylase MnmA [Methyloligella halotolerans]|uniref:tRNA-specific 2-thiouridylase MnmA n=1 Tax=Methyloligella halotolerans TaxID=1177755 RepID=A0A1E2RZS8_9HYPH|nr:tRNA-specific 2-thiouridylase MnmA [Methyloligella halotolerans]
MVELADGEEGVSPGQACVFYAADGDEDRVLGGGWITSAVFGEDEFGGAAKNAVPERGEPLFAERR